MNIDLIKQEFVKKGDFVDKDDLIDNAILTSKGIPNDGKIFISIMRIQQIIEEQINFFLKAHDLSLPQMNVLEMLYFSNKTPLTPDDISKMIFTSKANISTLLSRMEESGLIKREENSQNRRQKNVFLLKNGEKLLHKVYDHMDEMDKLDAEVLPDNDAKELLRLLSKLKGNMKEQESRFSQ